jgi:hypothetical protein
MMQNKPIDGLLHAHLKKLAMLLLLNLAAAKQR